MDAMVDGVTVTDLHEKIIYVNRAVTEQLGYEKEELIGKTPIGFIAEKDKPKFAAEAKKVLLGEPIPKISEYLAKRKDGTKIPMSVNFSILRDPEGRPKEIIAVSRDITERERAEEALRESEVRFRRLFDELGDAVFVTRYGEKGHDKILEANPAAENLTGYSRDELIGMSVVEDLAVGEWENTIYKQAREKLLNGETASFTEQKLRKDGTKCWTEVIITPIEHGGERAALSISRDITERKKAEEERIEAVATRARAEEAEKHAKELEKKVEQLETFTRAAVGRELKMVELKKRIEELESKLKEKS